MSSYVKKLVRKVSNWEDGDTEIEMKKKNTFSRDILLEFAPLPLR